MFTDAERDLHGPVYCRPCPYLELQSNPRVCGAGEETRGREESNRGVCVCVCVLCEPDRKDKSAYSKGCVCVWGKGRLESVRREFPNFSKRTAHIQLLNFKLFAEPHDTHRHTSKCAKSFRLRNMCVLVYEQGLFLTCSWFSNFQLLV